MHLDGVVVHDLVGVIEVEIDEGVVEVADRLEADGAIDRVGDIGRGEFIAVGAANAGADVHDDGGGVVREFPRFQLPRLERAEVDEAGTLPELVIERVVDGLEDDGRVVALTDRLVGREVPRREVLVDADGEGGDGDRERLVDRWSLSGCRLLAIRRDCLLGVVVAAADERKTGRTDTGGCGRP